MSKFTSIRAAKESLKERYQGETWYRGAGLVSSKRLRLNVAPGHAGGLPKLFEGYELEVVEIGKIVAYDKDKDA